MSRSSGPPKKADPKTSLLEIHVNTRDDINTRRIFEDNPVRIALKKVGFDPDSTYGILKTVFNPDAAEVLRSRSERSSEGMGFHASLQAVCDIYMDALACLVEKAGIGHATYPMVVNDNVHSLDRHEDQPFWPIAHIIRVDGGNSPLYTGIAFRNIASCLNDRDIYRFIKQRQAPQNYHMADVDALRNNAVNPILVQDDSIFIGGNKLKTMVDFLCPYRYAHRSKPNPCGTD